jgi:hypothetical protein
MRFADPGRTWITVTPPAIASGICGSCGQNECSAQTSAVTACEISLPYCFGDGGRGGVDAKMAVIVDDARL